MSDETLPPVTPQKNKAVVELLDQDDLKFLLIFQSTAKTRATSVSSDDLKTAVGKLSDAKLENVRKCSNLPKSYLFSINGTNTVEDSMRLSDYISSTKDNVTAFREAAKAQPPNTAILTVQFISKHRPPTEIPKHPTLPTLPTDGDKPLVIDPKDKAPEAVNIATTGLLAEGKISSTHPAELTDKEWNDVMKTNSLLHGMFLDMTTYTFHKAREPAFELSKTSIPAIDVDDDSSVTITEVKSTYEHSMTQHGFSASSVEASASGGYGPVSGGASASVGWSSSHSDAKSKAKATDTLHASYNFPRVRVFFDSDDLAITEECKAFLKTIKDGRKFDDVANFFKKYGHIFAGSVQLGGRLQTTKESDACKGASVHEKKDALKVAAAVSISTPYASGSVSASHSSGTNTGSTNVSGKGSENLAWEAQGGETLLASNPSAWIASVGSFYNWRVMGRSDVQDILLLLKRISNKTDEDWPTIFNSIEAMRSMKRDPLVFSSPPSKPNEIIIRNETFSKFRVAVSRAQKSTQFSEIEPGGGVNWPRDGYESVFINNLESDRVVIAMANAGLYKLVKLPVDPPSKSTPGISGSIGVNNTTTTLVRVKVTTLDPTELPVFFSVLPRATQRWIRKGYQTVFVRHMSSNILDTFIGTPGFDIHVGEARPSSLPHFHAVPGRPKEVNVYNAQDNDINVKISVAPGGDDPQYFSPLKPGDTSTRNGVEPEVVYLNGPHGTSVGAYYANPGETLVVDHPISYDGE